MRTSEITVHTGRRRGVFDITAQCQRFVAEVLAEPAARGDVDALADADAPADADASARDGLLVVFVPHATCGLAVMELGSGSEEDLLTTLDRLLPRDDRYVHRHGPIGHGADHLVPAFLPPSITIPVVAGQLALGTWQSIALVDTNVGNETRRVRLSLTA